MNRFKLLNLRFLVITFLLGALVIGQPISAQSPELVKDINADLDDLFVTGLSSYTPVTFAPPSLGQQIIVGRGLSETQGTELLVYKIGSNSYEFIDINPGAGSSSPSGFTVFGNVVIFSANDGASGFEVWKTDGTVAGTVRIADLEDGALGTDPYGFTVLGSNVIFAARTVSVGAELYKTDGSTITLLKNIFTGGTGSNPNEIVAGSGVVYFTARSSAEGIELWKSDGNSAGTVIVKDIIVGSGSSSPQYLHFDTASNSLYFSANSTGFGVEPWKSNGLSAGTTQIVDLRAGTLSSAPSGFRSALGKVFFAGRNSSSGVEPFVTDGSAPGTVLVGDINSGGNSSFPQFFGEVGGRMIFTAENPSIGRELWASDGTVGSATNLTDLIPGELPSQPFALGSMSANQFLFVANSSNFGKELFTTDGISATMLKDIFPGINSSLPFPIVRVNNSFYFTAINQVAGQNKRILMTTDGVAGNTAVINSTVSPISGSSDIQQPADFGGKYYFVANNGLDGNEIWSSDGSAAGTELTINLAPGLESLEPAFFTGVGSKLFFQTTNSVNRQNIYVSEGGNSAAVRLTDFTEFGTLGYQGVALNNKFIFLAYTDATGSELWQSDGTLAGTSIIADILPGNSGAVAEISQGAVLNGKLYFGADDGTGTGHELWSTDGNTAALVADIDPAGASYPNSIVALNSSQIIFVAGNSGVDFGQELYVSNGTSSGTTILKDIEVGSDSSYISNLVVAKNGVAFFTAQTVNDGTELWKTNGTPAGTEMVRDIVVGPSSPSFSAPFVALGEGVLFAADDGSGAGEELWYSDGTSSGTIMLKDIAPGSASSSISDLRDVSAPGLTRAYFSANDGTNGAELWSTDGTPAGTILVGDIAPGVDSSSPANLMASNGTLFFRAKASLVLGSELWKVVFDSCPLDADKIVPGACGCGVSDADSDADGALNCQESCAFDPGKLAPGVCGCGSPDQDLNANAVLDCLFGSELKIKLTELKSAVKKLINPGDDEKKKKKSKARIKSVKTVLKGVVDYHATNAAAITTTNASDLTALIEKVRKAANKATKVSSKSFSKNRKKALTEITSVSALVL